MRLNFHVAADNSCINTKLDWKCLQWKLLVLKNCKEIYSVPFGGYDGKLNLPTSF